MSRPFRASRNLAPFPRALPWAGMSRPFRAATNFVALSVTLSPLSKAAGKAHAKARKREEWEPRIHANSREFTQNGVSGWSKRAVKSEFKRGFGVGAPHLHLVSTPCLHTLSPHLVSTPCLHTLSKAKEQANVPAPRSLPMRYGARGLRGSAETSPGSRPPSTPSRLVNDSISTA
jgi:hypothetical protein